MEKVLGVLKVLRGIGCFCREIDKSTFSGNESTFLGMGTTFLGKKSTILGGDINKKHFWWQGVESEFCRSSLGRRSVE